MAVISIHPDSGIFWGSTLRPFINQIGREKRGRMRQQHLTAFFISDAGKVYCSAGTFPLMKHKTLVHEAVVSHPVTDILNVLKVFKGRQRAL